MKKLFILPLVALLASCATTVPIQNKEPTLSATNTVLNFHGKDEAFMELKITKTSRTKTLVAAKTLSFILGGGTVTGFSKDEVIGEEITDAVNSNRIKTPAYNIHEEIKKHLASMEEKNPQLKEKKYWTPITLTTVPPLWNLVYENLSSNDNKYRLHFGLEIRRSRFSVAETLFGNQDVSSSVAETCSYKSDVYLLDEWKANDYQKVAELKPQIVQKCLETFIPFLPELVKPQKK